MATYEVSLVIEGVEGKLETHRNEGAAYAAADRLAQEAQAALGEEKEQITWNVYVTPLAATYTDEDDVFLPSMPDHKPYRSG